MCRNGPWEQSQHQWKSVPHTGIESLTTADALFCLVEVRTKGTRCLSSFHRAEELRHLAIEVGQQRSRRQAEVSPNRRRKTRTAIHNVMGCRKGSQRSTSSTIVRYVACSRCTSYEACSSAHNPIQFSVLVEMSRNACDQILKKLTLGSDKVFPLFNFWI